jgi:hypothetical protein
MKHFIPLFVFIVLHNPMFAEIFVATDSIILVSPGVGWCHQPALTRVVTADGSQCVVESAENIMRLLIAADPETKVHRAGDAPPPEPPAKDEDE